MPILLFMIFYSTLSTSGPNDEANMENAQKTTMKAVLALPDVVAAQKVLEKKALRYSPIDREYLVIIGPAAMTVYQGKVDTKIIKKMDMHVLGGVMRPDLLYNYKTQEAQACTSIRWSF